MYHIVILFAFIIWLDFCLVFLVCVILQEFITVLLCWRNPVFLDLGGWVSICGWLGGVEVVAVGVDDQVRLVQGDVVQLPRVIILVFGFGIVFVVIPLQFGVWQLQIVALGGVDVIIPNMSIGFFLPFSLYWVA